MTMMRPTASRSRSALLAAMALAAFAAVGLGEAAAQTSCQTDFEKLAGARNARIAAVNALQKKGKGKLDPIAACPRLNALVASEQAMIGYMVKNQKWCSIPDEVIAQARAGSAKTRGIAGQACGIAGKVRQMQAQALKQQKLARQRAAEGGGGAPMKPALPAGPL